MFGWCFGLTVERVLAAPANTRLEQTRHERASLLSCAGEPLKRSVRRNFLSPLGV